MVWPCPGCRKSLNSVAAKYQCPVHGAGTPARSESQQSRPGSEPVPSVWGMNKKMLTKMLWRTSLQEQGCHSNVGGEGQLSSSVAPRFRALQIRDTSEIVVVMVRSWKGDVLSAGKRARPCQGWVQVVCRHPVRDVSKTCRNSCCHLGSRLGKKNYFCFNHYHAHTTYPFLSV